MTLALPLLPPKVLRSPGLPAGREGTAQGTCLCPLASATLTLKEDVSAVWDIHNTSKHNATTLLRHESVVFKGSVFDDSGW